MTEFDSDLFDAMTPKQWEKEKRRHKDKPIEYFLQVNEEERQEKLEELEKYYLKQNKPPGISRQNKEVINVVMFGKTGHGKSSTANTIVSRPFFPESGKSSSCTKNIAVCHTEYEGQVYKIVDTPGLFDTVTKQEEIKFELSKVIDECITGIDVFLYVHSGNGRFSPEEQETVRELENLFGSEITQYSFLAVTRADTFLKKTDLKTFVSDSAEVTELHEFIKKIERRVVALNNDTETVIEKKFMQKLLIDMISIVRHGTNYRSYTNALFEEARKKQREAEEKRRQQLEDERRKEAEEMQRAITKMENYFAERLEAQFAKINFQEIRSMKEGHFKDVVITMKSQLSNEGSTDLKRASETVPNLDGIIEKMAEQSFSERENKEREKIQEEERKKAEEKMKEFERKMKLKEEENKRIAKDREEMERRQEEIEQHIQQFKAEAARAERERDERHREDVERLRKQNEENQRLLEEKIEAKKRMKAEERDRVRREVDEHVRSQARDFLMGHSKLDLSWMKGSDIRKIRQAIIEHLPIDERRVFSDAEIDTKIKKELKILEESLDYTVPQHLLRPVRAVAEGVKSVVGKLAGFFSKN